IIHSAHATVVMTQPGAVFGVTRAKDTTESALPSRFETTIGAFDAEEPAQDPGSRGLRPLHSAKLRPSPGWKAPGMTRLGGANSLANQRRRQPFPFPGPKPARTSTGTGTSIAWDRSRPGFDLVR